MPVTPKSSLSRRKHDDQSPSQRSPRKRAPAPSAEDKSKWRRSYIPADSQITKTASLIEYRLNEKEIEGLKRHDERTVKKIEGVDTIVPMYLYNEQEVEMKAWEKYGGPHGFEEILNSKEEKFYEKHGRNSGKVFRRPRSYPSATETDPMAPVMTPAELSRIPDPETATPGLIEMRDELYKQGKKWLWDAMNEAIGRLIEQEYSEPNPGMRKAEREAAVSAGFDSLVDDHPDRPPVVSPTPFSGPEFMALLTTLRNAPVYIAGRHSPGVLFDLEDGSVEWVPSYVEKVYTHLSAVYKTHGIDGWKQARWFVYDKYVECNIGGLACHKGPDYHRWQRPYDWQWNDTAIFWLKFDGNKIKLSD